MACIGFHRLCLHPRPPHCFLAKSMAATAFYTRVHAHVCEFLVKEKQVTLLSKTLLLYCKIASVSNDGLLKV